MGPELSRADLLRILTAVAVAEVGGVGIAESLGWEFDATRTGLPPADTAPARRRPNRRTAQTIPRPSVRYLARRNPLYWRVAECLPLIGQGPMEDDPDAVLSRLDAGAGGPRARDQAMDPLLRPGQWQNLWDRLPPRQRGSRFIDVRASVRALARARPVDRLPRRPRRGFNRGVTLILDRPAALRPAWDDMNAARRSLQTLLSDGYQGFHLPAGPKGAWLCLDQSGLGSREDIPPGALVVLIGVFGGLESGRIGADWRDLLGDLGAGGHDWLLVSLCPLRPASDRLIALDPAQYRRTRSESREALEALLAALSQTWLPNPTRLRRLRRAIPGASLHTELSAYNHPWVRSDDFHLGLRTQVLLAAVLRFHNLPDAVRQPLRRAIEDWRAGLDAAARDIERLQADLLDPRGTEAYPHLLRLSERTTASLDASKNMALAQFCAMLPVLREVRKRVDDARLQSVFRRAERVARATRRLPPGDGTSAAADGPARWLVQRRDRLLVEAGPGGLLEVTPQAYCRQLGALLPDEPRASGGDLGLTALVGKVTSARIPDSCLRRKINSA